MTHLSSVFGERIVVQPRLFKISTYLEPEQKLKTKYYTAKLVKRIVINANPGIEKLFQPTRGIQPKLIHITPLYAVKRQKIRTIHYTTELMPNYYAFYIGLLDGPIDPYIAYNMTNIDEIEFAKVRINIYVKEVKEINIDTIVKETLKAIEEYRKIKLIFSSPTVLRDPLTSTMHKTLIPSTMNIFSTPVYIWLYATGKLRYKTLMKILTHLHRAFTVPPTYLQTVKKLDLHYEPGKRIPTLIGYINLHYNPENDPNKQALDILKQILPLVLALGVGVGRASGFGHITTQPPKTNHSFILW